MEPHENWNSRKFDLHWGKKYRLFSIKDGKVGASRKYYLFRTVLEKATAKIGDYRTSVPKCRSELLTPSRAPMSDLPR